MPGISSTVPHRTTSQIAVIAIAIEGQSQNTFPYLCFVSKIFYFLKLMKSRKYGESAASLRHNHCDLQSHYLGGRKLV